jgi:hypothetical protein
VRSRWFPSKKGTVQGAIISGMGASAFLFNIVATKLVNPTGADMVDGVFPPSVAARWPPLLRTVPPREARPRHTRLIVLLMLVPRE